MGMAYEWIKTKFLGVRYRLHKTRKHGVNFDKCYSIRYKVNGKDKEEVAGWASEGMSAEKAFKLLSEIRENIRLGEAAKSLAEIRQAKEEAKREEDRQKGVELRSQVCFDQFWNDKYLPQSAASKTSATLSNEKSIYAKWLSPHLGTLRLSALRPSHIESLIIVLTNENKSPQTIRHVIALISQIWNMAHLNEVVQGDNPCKYIKKPQQDSRRIRFLTPSEAKLLLQKLKERSKDTYDAAVFSLFAGLRAGEIHNLCWADIDFESKLMHIRDPKNNKSRHSYLTDEIIKVLESRKPIGSMDDLIIPSIKGEKRTSISDTFERVVDELGLNSSITDRRHKVVFHTLRHTFASWLVQAGTPLYTVAELMGHSSLEMTKRYAHLSPDNMRNAVINLSSFFKNI